MKIEDLFPTRTSLRLLDLLLKHPRGVASQGILANQLGVAPITLRRTLKRLEAVGLVEVDVNPVGVGIKAVTFNGDGDAGRALLSLHRRIRKIKI
jgi:DNA-binding IclR family transcriptional regulator